MQGSVVVGILLACATGFAFADPGSGPEKFQRVMSAFAQMLETNATWRAEFEQQVAEEKAAMSINYTFNCQVDNATATPRTVHELRPQDINVIAALGDSITAGNGIYGWTPIGVLMQKRGESWCIGGDGTLGEGVHTISNVMRRFNQDINGYSTGSGFAGSENAWLNFAVPGAKARGIPRQAERLIEKMKNDSRIDFDNDWKLITLLIGGNDLCGYCKNRTKHSPQNYKQHLQDALDKLHAEVPRVLVNLVAMVDVSPITSIRSDFYCPILHMALCSCALNKTTKLELKETQKAYYNVMEELASGKRYNVSDEFTVVMQPHLLDQDFPLDPETNKYDKSFIAPDCFHPNKKAHQALSFFYWNTMLTPVGQKPTYHDWNPSMDTTYKCPTKDQPYIFTNRNSPLVVTTTGPTGETTVSSTTAPTAVSSTTPPAEVTTTAPEESTTTAPAESTSAPPTDSTTTAPAESTTTAPAGRTTTAPAESTSAPPTDSITTEPAGSSASSQFACSQYVTLLRRVFLYGPLLAVILY